MTDPMGGPAWTPPAPTTNPAAPTAPAPDQRTVAFRLSWVTAEGDFVEALRAIRASQGRGGLFVVLAAAACLVLAAFLDHNRPLAAAGIAALASLLYFAGPGRIRMLRKTWRSSPAWHGERWLEVSPEAGITEWSPGDVAARAWWRYTEVMETERTFVLVLGGMPGKPAQIIPKRALPQGVDPAALGHALRGWVGGPPRP